MDPAAPPSRSATGAPSADAPQEAPMPGTPLGQRQLERLKERAKSSVVRGMRGQRDPAAKK
jgi:hypothetical protein